MVKQSVIRCWLASLGLEPTHLSQKCMPGRGKIGSHTDPRGKRLLSQRLAQEQQEGAQQLRITCGAVDTWCPRNPQLWSGCCVTSRVCVMKAERRILYTISYVIRDARGLGGQRITFGHHSGHHVNALEHFTHNRVDHCIVHLSPLLLAPP